MAEIDYNGLNIMSSHYQANTYLPSEEFVPLFRLENCSDEQIRLLGTLVCSAADGAVDGYEQGGIVADRLEDSYIAELSALFTSQPERGRALLTQLVAGRDMCQAAVGLYASEGLFQAYPEFVLSVLVRVLNEFWEPSPSGCRYPNSVVSAAQTSLEEHLPRRLDTAQREWVTSHLNLRARAVVNLSVS